MEIFKLFGSVFVDNTKANESLSKTDDKGKGLASTLGNGIKTAGKFGLALGGAAVAGGTALFGMAQKTMDATDRIDKMSAKVGISKQAFQEWDYVLGQNGMDVEKLQVGVKTLTSKMDAAASGNKIAMESFNALGLSWEDGNGKLKSQEEMMNEAIIALANMENGTEKAKLATELFGKAGIEMMPMLNGGAEGIEQLKNRSHELGLVMSDETVTAGVVLGDTLADVKQSFGMVATKVGAEVMPVIQNLLDWILQYMPQIQSCVSTVFKVIEGLVTSAVRIIQWLIDAFGKLFDGVDGNSSSIKDVIQSLLSKFQEIFGLIKELINTFVSFCKTIWDKWGTDITSIFKSTFSIIQTVFKTALDIITGIVKAFIALFSGDWETFWLEIKNIFKSAWEGIRDLVPQLIDLVIQKFKLAFSIFKNVGKEMFSMVWEGMKSIWTSISNWVNEKISWLTDKLIFWKKGSDEMNSSGNTGNSHAGGRDYIPYDNYQATLHRGERVLTASENREYNNGNNVNSNSISISGEITIPVVLDGNEIARITAPIQDMLQGNTNKLSLRRAGV